MKKIISHLSITTMVGILLLFSLSIQHTTSINQILAASANPETKMEITEDLSPSADVTTPLPNLPTTPVETPQITSALIIKAINPGYTVDGNRDVGEFIELQNSTDASLSLAGYSLRYTNSSGKQTTLIDFSEGGSMVGEFLLLRLARRSDGTDAEATYTTAIAATNARLELLLYEEVVDQVCWSRSTWEFANNCAKVFDSDKPSTLVRNSVTETTFQHLYTDYELHYDVSHPTLKLPPEPENPTETLPPNADITQPSTPDDTSNSTSQKPNPQCSGLEFTEVLAYYSDDSTEQFIELYNATDQEINLTGCSISYKKKTYPLSGQIQADDYFVIYPINFKPSFTLTKNPSSSNTIELIDADGTTLDILIYSHGQKKSMSYAKFIDTDGSESWNLTYAPTPGEDNTYQEFRTCPAGKVINPATGNCIKVTATSTTTSECPAGKYRNPLTGRCKNIESSTTELKLCSEGYERNPETNRCRKVKAENDGAGYALVPTTYSNKSTFVALGIVILLVSLGAIYIILQFRHELARAARKARQRLYHVRKNLVARGISLHRHKKP